MSFSLGFREMFLSCSSSYLPLLLRHTTSQFEKQPKQKGRRGKRGKGGRWRSRRWLHETKEEEEEKPQSFSSSSSRLPHLSGLLAFALRGTREGLVEEEVVEDVVLFEIGCEEERGRGEEEEGR